MQPEQTIQTNTRPAPGMDVVAPKREPTSASIDVGSMAPASTGTGVAFKPVVGSAAKSHWSDKPFIAESLDLCFRIGFGLVFIINSVTAIIQPAIFKKLLESNFLAHTLGQTQIMLYIIAVNDALLGVLIISGIKRQWIYAWAGLWLFFVTFLKFTSL